MRTKFATLLAIAAVCVTTAWADWTPEVLVTGNSAGRSTYPNNGRKLVFASDGVGHVVWSGGGVGCNRYNPSSGWTSDYQLSPTGDMPAVALDADGITIHVVWKAATVLYRRCTRSASGDDVWGDVVPLNAKGGPAIATVPGDPNHVVVCSPEAFYSGKRYLGDAVNFIECVGGVWGTPIRLDSAPRMRRRPSIAVAPNGDVFIAYYANDDNGTGRQVYVKMRDHETQTWGATVDVTSGLGSDQCAFPAIEVNPYTGNPHVVFAWMKVTKISKKASDTTHAVYHTYRNSQGAWLTMPELISVPRHGLSIGAPHNSPTMAFGSDGTAHAVWYEPTWAVSHGVMYSYCLTEGGTWTAPAWLTSDPLGDYMDNYPHVTVDEGSQAIEVVFNRLYSGMGGETEVWWRSNSLGGGGMGRPVALSQSGIELFPNPAKAGRVTVQYALPQAGPMTVTLLDVSGRTVHRSSFVVRRSGEGSFALDVRGLNAGVYVMKLESGTTSQTRKLVIQ